MENSKKPEKKKISNEDLNKVVGGMSREELVDLFNSRGIVPVRFINGPFKGEYGDVIRLYRPKDNPNLVTAWVQVFARLTTKRCLPDDIEFCER